MAGSEKVKKSDPTAKQLKEGISINKGLSALKEVIIKLSQDTQNISHVPYRNNPLTKLMKDSIGGNSKTLMFVNISPADYNSQESYMSLFFGSSAKQIKNDVRQNVESQEVTKLKNELDQLKRYLNSLSGPGGPVPVFGSSQRAAYHGQNAIAVSPPMTAGET